MYDKVFNINFKKLAVLWLPTFLRSASLTAFSFVLISPLELMYANFINTRLQALERMRHNYQVFSVENRLNDVFDKVERRIKIVSAIKYNGVYIYTEGEDDVYHNKTKWLKTDKPIYLRSESELFTDYDFIIQIPDTDIDQLQLKAETEYFILPSKRYTIIII